MRWRPSWKCRICGSSARRARDAGATNNEFACIVLDIQMPTMSGLDLAKLIKGRKRNQHIPIIFLTAYFLEERDILHGYGVGAVDYLTKPVIPQILRSKVGVFVDLFRTARALSAANALLEFEVAQRKKAEEALRLTNNELEALSSNGGGIKICRRSLSTPGGPQPARRRLRDRCGSAGHLFNEAAEALWGASRNWAFRCGSYKIFNPDGSAAAGRMSHGHHP